MPRRRWNRTETRISLSRGGARRYNVLAGSAGVRLHGKWSAPCSGSGDVRLRRTLPSPRDGNEFSPKEVVVLDPIFNAAIDSVVFPVSLLTDSDLGRTFNQLLYSVE